jgi:hypothetical protein
MGTKKTFLSEDPIDFRLFLGVGRRHRRMLVADDIDGLRRVDGQL